MKGYKRDGLRGHRLGLKSGWTQEEYDTLVTLWNEGMSASLIAERLGKTVVSVRNYVVELRAKGALNKDKEVRIVRPTRNRTPYQLQRCPTCGRPILSFLGGTDIGVYPNEAL